MTTGVDAQTCKVIVLDSNIESMTEFKQIIGRGTRVREDFGKTYFTILDFRNVTKLFADPEYDGDPVKVYEPKNEDEFNDVIDEIESQSSANGSEASNLDPESTSNEVYIPTPTNNKERNVIHTISGKQVEIVGERVQMIDSNGKLITESLTDYTKRTLLGNWRIRVSLSTSCCSSLTKIWTCLISYCLLHMTKSPPSAPTALRPCAAAVSLTSIKVRPAGCLKPC
jgi:type I restriction enzyme R subunit